MDIFKKLIGNIVSMRIKAVCLEDAVICFKILFSDENIFVAGASGIFELSVIETADEAFENNGFKAGFKELFIEKTELGCSLRLNGNGA